MGLQQRGRLTSLSNRQHAVALVQEAQSNGARLVNACPLVGISVRTFLRWTQTEEVARDRRPEAERPVPSNKLTPTERKAIIETSNLEKYRSYPPAFIVADLADRGVYLASESTFYRVLHKDGQVNHRGRQKAPKTPSAPTSHTADGPNQLWSWDISWLPGPARGAWYYLYLIMDVYSRKIVGQEVYESETGELACDVLQKSYWREHLANQEKPLVLHSDNGSPMKAATFLEKLYDLGIVRSNSRPRVSNDNAFSEALFKTVKFRPGYPVDGFSGLQEAREWMLAFTRWYNTVHRHSNLNYVTPDQRHRGEDADILSKRSQVYQDAKQRNPGRWSGDIRNFSLPESVDLNPVKAANC